MVSSGHQGIDVDRMLSKETFGPSKNCSCNRLGLRSRASLVSFPIGTRKTPKSGRTGPIPSDSHRIDDGKPIAGCSVRSATNISAASGQMQRISIKSLGRVRKQEMTNETATPEVAFQDRRSSNRSNSGPGVERRQFQDGKRSSRPEVAEFANAVDSYKISNRRRFITFDELYDVFTSLGYHK